MELAWLSRDAPPVSSPSFANAEGAVVTPEAVGEGGIGWGGEVTVNVQDSVASSTSPPFRGSPVTFSPTRPVVRSPPLRSPGSGRRSKRARRPSAKATAAMPNEN